MATTILIYVLKVLLCGALASYPISTLITLCNNAASRSRIRRNGKEILPITTNSFFENVKYFFKDFGFLLLPIYNVGVSLKQWFQKDSDFDKEKIAKLKDRDRLVSCSDEEPTPVQPVQQQTQQVVQQQTQQAVQQPVQQVVPQQTQRVTLPARRVQQPVQQPVPQAATTVVSADGMTSEARRAYYKAEFDRLEAERTRLKALNAPVEVLDRYSDMMQDCINRYLAAERQSTLNNLIEQRDSIILSSNAPTLNLNK